MRSTRRRRARRNHPDRRGLTSSRRPLVAILLNDRFVTSQFACTDTKLRQLVRLMGRHYDAELRKAGLRTTQFWLLTEVLEHGPARPCDLAKAMALEPSTLARTLKPLIAAGWLELAAGADRRTRSVRITSSGRMKRAEGLRRWQSADTRVRELLGAENVKRLDAVLDDSLEAVPAAG